MSNYRWVKMGDGNVQLRKEDFSCISKFTVNKIDPILKEKLENNGIDFWTEGDGFFENCRYVLSEINQKVVTITAPLYKFEPDANSFVLISETYTDETINPVEYEWVKKIYLRCAKEVFSEQAEVFEEEFMEHSLDGISSFVTISSDYYQDPNYFYEQYIPEGYIKVCERNCPFSSIKRDVVFIKKMDAKRQGITIKVHDLYKGLVIGKGGENIKRIANMINAKKINVI